MSISIDGTTISIYQGDSGSITFTDLEEGMVIYFGVRDKKNNTPVFEEIRGVVDSKGEVTFDLTAEMTDLFNVKISEKFATYYYGIKQVDEITGEENTVFLGDKECYGTKYIMKVYPKKVEGLESGEG